MSLLIALSYRRKFTLFKHSVCSIKPVNAVLRNCEISWTFFGGIPRYVVLDNFPAAIVGADPLNPRLTRGFLEYAQQPDGKDKGRVRQFTASHDAETGVFSTCANRLRLEYD